MKKRVKKILGWGVFTLLVMAVSSVFLADHLMPPATGLPSYALSVEADATPLDRELAPLLARHPGQTGAILLPDGIDAYAARALSARQAGRSLDLQYYIWHDDLTGRMLANEAWEAAERGVRVRMLLDDMGIGTMDATLLTLDSHPNIELRVYNPFRNRSGVMRVLEMVQRAWGINHRMHNKAWIADGRVAVVGGRNIGVEYFSAAEDTNFHDLDVMVFGPTVVDASRIFDRFWNSEAVVPIAGLNRKPKTTIRDMLAQIQEEAESPEARRYLDAVDMSASVRRYATGELSPFWTDSLRIVSDPPAKWRDDTGEDLLVPELFETIDSAQRSALLISPYFVPGTDGTEWLSGLSRDRKVQVAVVTNSLAPTTCWPCTAAMRATACRCSRPTCACTRSAARPMPRPKAACSAAAARACTPRPSWSMAAAGSSARSTWIRARSTSTRKWGCCSTIRRWARRCSRNTST